MTAPEDEPIPDTLPAPPPRRSSVPPRPSSGPRTRPSSPSALRVDEILRDARRAAGLPEEPPPADPEET